MPNWTLYKIAGTDFHYLFETKKHNFDLFENMSIKSKILNLCKENTEYMFQKCVQDAAKVLAPLRSGLLRGTWLPDSAPIAPWHAQWPRLTTSNDRMACPMTSRIRVTLPSRESLGQKRARRELPARRGRWDDPLLKNVLRVSLSTAFASFLRADSKYLVRF